MNVIMFHIQAKGYKNVVLEYFIQRNEMITLKCSFGQIIKIVQKSSFLTPKHPIGTLPSRIAVFKMKTSTVNFLDKHDHTELFVVSFFEIQPRSLQPPIQPHRWQRVCFRLCFLPPHKSNRFRFLGIWRFLRVRFRSRKRFLHACS